MCVAGVGEGLTTRLLSAMLAVFVMLVVSACVPAGTAATGRTSEATTPADSGFAAGSDETGTGPAQTADASGSQGAAAAFSPAAPATADDIPAWASWRRRLTPADLDGDGVLEVALVAGRRLWVYGQATDAAEKGTLPSSVVSSTSVSGSSLVCATDADWLVSDCLVGDIDSDGTFELILLVWAPGTYGSSRPFWAENDTAYHQHVYLLRYEAGELVPLWMSSGLSFEAASASLDEQERIHLVTPAGEDTVWAWRSWGLGLVS